MDREKLFDVIKAIAKEIEAEKELLTDLDNAIGDGDHGINMARGFKVVLEKLSNFVEKDCGAVLKGVGISIHFFFLR